MAKLTETQNTFIKHLFGKASGNLKEASKLTIEDEDYSTLMTQELLDAIKVRADAQLVMSVPKAIFLMSKMLDDPDSIPFQDKLHKICADVLDRAGLSKVERGSGASTTIGILILPNKQILPEPSDIQTIEQIKTQMLT